MATHKAVIWKADPGNRALLHSVKRMEWGEALTHCGKLLEVETAKSDSFGTYDKRCPSCEARR